MSTIINNYLKTLRDRGYNFYSLEEVIEKYESQINFMVNNGYDDFIEEFENDMEFWNILDNIRKLINEFTPNDLNNTTFIKRMEKADKLLLENCIQVESAPGLPWWYYIVLKKGNEIYAEDVKITYGIDIDVIS